MITNLPQDELLALGARHRVGYLAEQGGYTLGLAAKDGTKLTALLPAKFLAEVQAELDNVTASMKDKSVMAAESKDATYTQNEVFAKAKVWRRKVTHRCRRAVRMGTKMPDELVKPSDVRSVPALTSQIDRMVKLLETEMAGLSTDTAALIKEGLEISKTLKSADAAQEIKRLKELPDAVKAFYLHKGILYTGIKVINDAGRELHAGDPEAAAAYNLSILNRHHSGKKEAEKQPQTQETK